MSRQWFQRWDTWWCRQAPPHALAIVRISFGLFLLVYMATFVPYTSMLFSDAGMVLPRFISAIPSVAQARILMGTLVAAIVCMTIGYRFRLAMVVILAISAYFWLLQWHMFSTSYVRLFTVLLVVLTFSGADRTLSLRMKRQHGSWLAAEPISILPQRLIAVQVTATYVGVGLQKLVLSTWQSGDVLAYSFVGLWATPLAFWVSRLNLPMSFYDVMVEATILLEIFIPIGLWYAPWRKWAVAGGVAFHFGVTIFLGIWWFMALYPLYILFPEPEVTEQWVEKRKVSLSRKKS